jgi:hypothetical protein
MWISHSSASAGSSSSFSVFSGVLRADKFDGVGVRRYHNGQRTGTLGGFLNVPWDLPVSFIKNLYWQKSKLMFLELISLSTRLSELINFRLKEFCCTSNTLCSKTGSLTKFVRVQKFLYESNQHTLEIK